MYETHEVSQCETTVGHKTLDLVKLRQVGRVQGLIAEHTVDGKVLHGGESLLKAELFTHDVGVDHCTSTYSVTLEINLVLLLPCVSKRSYCFTTIFALSVLFDDLTTSTGQQHHAGDNANE